MKWTQSLAKWRKDRNITKPSGKFIEMIEEELQEYKKAVEIGDEHGIIDAIADIMVLSENEMALNKYNSDLVLKQVVKEISSRNQDPEQANKDWSDEKWKKDPNQDPSTLYKADFSTCKLKAH